MSRFRELFSAKGAALGLGLPALILGAGCDDGKGLANLNVPEPAIVLTPVWQGMNSLEQKCRQQNPGYTHPNRSCVRAQAHGGQKIIDTVRIVGPLFK